MSHASIHTNIFFFDKPNLAKKNCLSERTLMHPKDADSIANIEYPDQTASLGTDLGNAIFAQTNLSENLVLTGVLRLS